MPKHAQPGQVVHGGKNFEKAARKEAAKKQKKADKEAEYAIWQEGVAHVRRIQEKLREARVDFKTAPYNSNRTISQTILGHRFGHWTCLEVPQLVEMGSHKCIRHQSKLA